MPIKSVLVFLQDVNPFIFTPKFLQQFAKIGNKVLPIMFAYWKKSEQCIWGLKSICTDSFAIGDKIDAQDY